MILATQGAQLINLAHRESQHSEDRLGQIKAILSKVNQLQPAFMRAEEHLSGYRHSLTTHLHEEQRRLRNHFDELRRELEVCHQKCLFTLKLHHDALLEEIERSGESLGASWAETQRIKEDILPNVSSIMEPREISQDYFCQIIDNYHLIIASAQEKVSYFPSFEMTCYAFSYPEIQ